MDLWAKIKDTSFYKVSASGNDFIVFLNLDQRITPEEGRLLAQKLCRPKFSISADGLIMIEKPTCNQAQFAWRFYNADGSVAEMCGNGARGVARLLREIGLVPNTFYLETLAGLIYAEVKGKRVKVALSQPKDLNLSFSLRTDYDWFMAHFVNTGVPHVVIFWEKVEEAPLDKLGPRIRYHEIFSPAGTNVNFVEVTHLEDEKILKVRTYERGVEGETLACGTGASAAAYVAYKLNLLKPPIKVLTKGGELLEIDINAENDQIYLEGDTLILCKMEVFEDSIR
ncbi:MAG: diaminopimelate epimerase [Caldimicrobium sp.]|nr:diaminopimelate epimerase [Caldimicrobium sp.]MCX7613112.1 diaminopimelate epimerase [Caldimicrobium sp.]MDW8182920.1 diaminopimelate epimerase [Caldimicrobium sp.]